MKLEVQCVNYNGQNTNQCMLKQQLYALQERILSNSLFSIAINVRQMLLIALL